MINLEKFKTEIQGLAPLDGSIMYSPEKWEKAFENKKSLLNCAAHLAGKQISRKTIIQQYKKYYKHTGYDFKTPFLYTMIWGYNSNYGPHRTYEIIKYKGNFDLIEQAIVSMKTNDLDSAFKYLRNVKGLGISYLSKILYFAGKARSSTNYPLIFDIRVATALVSLSSGGSLDSLLKVTPSDNLKSYIAYNKLIHDWALELDADADQVEFFLFEQKFMDP